MQGGKTIDIRRIYDAMNDFEEKQKDPRYAEAKPFMFILPGVSRYMTTPGRPDENENAILMILFNATQIEKTDCKLMMFVDKINDLPTWFESENNNSALKKLYIPTPDSKFRETFFELEMKDIMDPIPESEAGAKILKFSSYTENYSLRRLRQLKLFIEKEADNVDENVPSLRKIENIDKTVLRFDSGQSKDPWRDPELMTRIDKMGGNIANEILGQDKAIVSAIKALRVAATGVKSSKRNDRRPRAVLFFAGPTGVGKTELTKQISENIFQKQDSMIRFDMSEFREEHSDARLFGAPPGYVGYEAGGELTKAVKQNPFSVILFDEIEKAAPRIWDKFLQILGDGRLTDGKGETVSFTQSIIVFTSNLGITADSVTTDVARIERDNSIKILAEEIKALEYKIEASQDEAERKALVDKLYKRYFTRAGLEGLTCDIQDDYIFKKCYQELGEKGPETAFNKFTSECVTARIQSYFENIGRREILGRIGDGNILTFNFMTTEIAERIADVTIKRFIKTMKEEHDSQLDLEITAGAQQFIKAEVKKPKVINLGGREIVSCVDKLISEPISDFLSEPEYFLKTKLSAVMDVDNGNLFVELR
ncbi:MAG: ATP-dependent Clp protease ATP-binding subunit [Clostridia bacterium]|nr:ATP-dependent Clp protease ATP-binding subunit [Clostridia bacterium]